MFYIIYKITNKIDGKFYIGSHKTKNLDDNYMGSGKYLKYAQNKYGIENFKKEILFVFETAEEMYAREAKLVNEEFLATENTYNLKIGGFGGWDYINENPEKYLTETRLSTLMPIKETQKHWQKKYDTDENFRNTMLLNTAIASQKLREKYPEGTFKNKKHSSETKNRMSTIAKERLSDPTKNSQYGTMWITDGVISKKISKNESIPENWKKGRVM
jgi:hypothetical protein